MKLFLRKLPLIMLSASAACSGGEGASTADIEKKLREKFPDTKIESVQTSSIPGLVEVFTGTELVYADNAGTHLFLGKVVDIATRDDLTQKRLNELLAIDFNSLPFELAIKTVKGDGSRTLAVFADPFCPYCQEFERTLSQVDNVTVYVFLYPLEDLHPGARDAAREIWCAEDRSTAWTTWMLNEKAPGEASCADAPVEELVKLGERLHINSTPTLFFEDGSRLPGAIDASRLERKFETLKSKSN